MVSGKSHSPQKPPTKPKAKPPAAPKSKVDEIVDQVVEIVAAAVDEALTPANPFAHIPGSAEFVSWENTQRALKMASTLSSGTLTPAKKKPGRPKAAEKPKSNGPTPERLKHYLAEFTRLDTEGQRVNKAKSTCVKNFEKEGGNGKILKRVHALLKLDGGEASLELKRLFESAAAVGINVTWDEDGQGGLVDVLEAEQPAGASQGHQDLQNAMAAADGMCAGLDGAAASDNPFAHIPGSEQFVEWENARRMGLEDRAAMKPEEAARLAASKTADASLPGDTIGQTVNNDPF